MLFQVALFIYIVFSTKAFGYPPVLYGIIATYLIFYLLFQINIKLFYIIFGIYILTCTLYSPQAILYGQISPDIIAALFETHPQESIGYLRSIPLGTYLVAIAYLCVGVCLLLLAPPYAHTRQNKSNRPAIKPSKLIAIIILIIIAILARPISIAIKDKRALDLKSTRVFAVNFYIQLADSIYSYQKQRIFLQKNAQQPSTWQILSVQPSYQNYVVVIGESMRKDYLSAYGFPINTTPFLNHAPAKLYDGYVAATSHTYQSLLHTLNHHSNDAIQYNNNIITLANQAGFQTYWLSSQESHRLHDVFSLTMANRSSKFISIFNMNENAQDSALLPHFANILAQPSHQPRLIVVHLIGSHPPFCDRVEGIPLEFKFYSQDMSCYLQSLKATDEILQNLVKQLQQTHQSYNLIYFSDHGLSTIKDYGKSFAGKYTLRHGDHFRQNYQVPLIELSSTQHHQEHISLHQSGINFLQGWAERAGIKTQEFHNKPSFWNSSKQAIKVFNGKQWVNIESLSENPPLLPPSTPD